MKILFLNEGTFGTYKNKSNKEDRKEKLRKETAKISKNAARDEIKKFYGKVLKAYAMIAPKAISKACSKVGESRNLNYDVAATFDINTRIGWGGQISDSHELYDYENVAGSLYSTKECLDSNHESFIIPVEVTHDNGFIENSIIYKNVFYKALVKVFNECIDKVLLTEDLPLGLSKPKEFKILLLSSYTTSPWRGYNNEVPAIETLYQSIFNGTFKGSLYEIIDVGKYNNNYSQSNIKYIFFIGSNDKEQLNAADRLKIQSAKDIDEIIKVYPKIICNSRNWSKISIATSYQNSSNQELFDVINECAKNEITISNIDFRDDLFSDNGDMATGNKSIAIGVDRALNTVRIIDKLKDACPSLVNTELNFPKNISGGGFMIKADKKFLALKVDSKNTTSFTSLGKNIGIIKPAGKFIRNIYAIDVTDPSLKADLMKMIKLGSTNQDNIDISGKYETAIIAGVADHMITTFKKLLTLRPHCCTGNYLLFCSYTQDNMATIDEIIRIGFAELKEVKNKLTIQAAYDFKLACAQGFNPKYIASHSQQTAGKSYEYIAGKKTRIEIPV